MEPIVRATKRKTTRDEYFIFSIQQLTDKQNNLFWTRQYRGSSRVCSKMEMVRVLSQKTQSLEANFQ